MLRAARGVVFRGLVVLEGYWCELGASPNKEWWLGTAEDSGVATTFRCLSPQKSNIPTHWNNCVAKWLYTHFEERRDRSIEDLACDSAAVDSDWPQICGSVTEY
jgi:hypothetical protein